jgi:hypothetical protein
MLGDVAVNLPELVRLAGNRWCATDPSGRLVWIAYDERDELWEVRPEDAVEEQLDSDVRAALADASSADLDEPWIVVLADELEREPIEHQGGSDGHR